MAAGRRDLDRALGHFLALDVDQVRQRALLQRFHPAFRRGQHLFALEMVDQRQEGGRGEDVDLPRPGGFGPGRGRADQPLRPAGGVECCEQGAGDRGQAGIQRHFAHRQIALDLVRADHPHFDEEAEGDRQVEMAALLQDVGGREVDQDSLGRQGEADGVEGTAHPFPALRDRLVRQADDREAGQARGELHLDVDVEGVGPLKCHRAHARDQARLPRRCRRQG